MKRILFSAALLASTALQAQDTYVNHTMVNTTDLFGTARYVGMGGAMGALGADLSTISLNPAGIGMFRRNDISFTAGLQRQGDANTFNDNPSRGSFDQIGGVMSFHLNEDGMKYCNFAFNYQKKADFRHTFIGDNANTGGLSIVDQMLYVADNWGWSYTDKDGWRMPSPLGDALAYAGVMGIEKGELDGVTASGNEFLGRTSGGLHAFDFNISANHDDRVYWGITVGVDYLNYKEEVFYTEFCDNVDDNFDLQTWKRVHGVGVNGKFGVIFRPVEESPLRVGLTLETPTFYTLKMDATDDVKWWNSDRTGYSDSYLDYHLISPWRFRAAAGYTVGRWLALDVDYEYALYNRTRVAYGDIGYNDYYDDWGSLEKDRDLNSFTREQVRGVHSLKLGAEVQLGYGLALRAGYNYYSSAFSKDSYLAHDASSTALNVATTTHFTNTSDVNIATVGLGYKFKKGYIDLAYKYRAQSGDFYAFEDINLRPVRLNLDNHQLFCTLGYKF